MKQRYIILSAENEAGDQDAAPPDKRDGSDDRPPQPPQDGAPQAHDDDCDFDSVEPQGIQYEIADLDEREVKSLRRDPSLSGVIPANVPLTLIDPQPNESWDDGSPPWGLAAVGALASPRTGRGIRVAILDTGIKRDHPAFSSLLAERRIVSRNFTNADASDVSDTHGHGTHCAGIIAGGIVNGRRIGVAPGLDRLIVGKVLGGFNNTNETLIAAIQWAVSERANIVSMSLGIDFPGLVEKLILETGLEPRVATSMALKQYRDTISLYSKLADFLKVQNVLLVASTGNESRRPHYTIDVSPPAASEQILKVGAVSRPANGAFEVAMFSNTGPDFVAPGTDILSASLDGGLRAMNGTSMAAPHVVGVAALWAEHILSNTGVVTRGEIEAELTSSALRIAGRNIDLGRGLTRAPQA